MRTVDERDDDSRGDVHVAREVERVLRDGDVAGLRDRDGVDGDRVAEPPREEHPGQGDDERLDLEVVDHGPHRPAEGGADHEHDHDREQRRPAVLDEQREHERGKGDDCSDGKIDAAGEDDEGHPDRDDEEERVVDEDVEHDLPGREARVANRTDREHGGEQRQRHQDRHVLLRDPRTDAACGAPEPSRTSCRHLHGLVVGRAGRVGQQRRFATQAERLLPECR